MRKLDQKPAKPPASEPLLDLPAGAGTGTCNGHIAADRIPMESVVEQKVVREVEDEFMLESNVLKGSWGDREDIECANGSSRSGLDFNGEFEISIGECVDLYHECRFIGCVALARVLVETIVRRISRATGSEGSDFDEPIDKILESATEFIFVHPELSDRLRAWWTEGRGYLYLRPSVAGDRRVLEALAERGVALLRGLGGVLLESGEYVEVRVEDGEPFSNRLRINELL